MGGVPRNSWDFLLRQQNKYHSTPLSNDRSCLTTDPRSDGIFRSDPRSDRNFFSYFGKNYRLVQRPTPGRTVLFGPTLGRTATLVVVRVGGGGITFQSNPQIHTDHTDRYTLLSWLSKSEMNMAGQSQNGYYGHKMKDLMA
jgi:hypothetical protein